MRFWQPSYPERTWPTKINIVGIVTKALGLYGAVEIVLWECQCVVDVFAEVTRKIHFIGLSIGMDNSFARPTIGKSAHIFLFPTTTESCLAT